MRIVQINGTMKIGSTGKIMYELNDVLEKNGHEGYMVSAYSTDTKLGNQYCTNSSHYDVPLKSNILISRITGVMGYRHKKDTIRLIEWIDNINPDIIHLHNIHGDWIHLKTLFKYLEKKDMPVVWTLHDCWSFTGRCSHFELCGCNKWESECHNCHNKKVYPVTYFFDFSKKMFRDKKKMFTSLKNLTLVTPSAWLKKYVEQSFLQNYDVNVIHNGINTEKYESLEKPIYDKKIILGVASSWSSTKGFDDFLELDKKIDHSKYKIILVGLNNSQFSKIPSTIQGIKRTNNEQELINLYSSAYVFVNLTYQDNFPTTNIEALSCGTPVITYNTGGSPESVKPGTGFVVSKGDLDGVIEAIKKVDLLERSFCREMAIHYFDKKICYSKYLDLYETIYERANEIV